MGKTYFAAAGYLYRILDLQAIDLYNGIPKRTKTDSRNIGYMKITDRVILETYNGSAVGPSTGDPQENYWQLIGSKGIIVKDPFFCAKYPDEALKKERRVLVEFTKSFAAMGLRPSNDMKNCLWVPVSDLGVCD